MANLKCFIFNITNCFTYDLGMKNYLSKKMVLLSRIRWKDKMYYVLLKSSTFTPCNYCHADYNPNRSWPWLKNSWWYNNMAMYNDVLLFILRNGPDANCVDCYWLIQLLTTRIVLSFLSQCIYKCILGNILT